MDIKSRISNLYKFAYIFTLFVLHFHYSYYMDGRINRAEDFLKTRLLDTLAEQISKVTKVLKFYLNFDYK